MRSDSSLSCRSSVLDWAPLDFRESADEAADAGLARKLGEADGALVIDLERDLRLVPPQRIVGKLGRVHDRVEAAHSASKSDNLGMVKGSSNVASSSQADAATS
jgi:hypothetical protein